ncbi:hypothetical protein BJX99DRAFT_126523 [Aspergillus californicus]
MAGNKAEDAIAATASPVAVENAEAEAEAPAQAHLPRARELFNGSIHSLRRVLSPRNIVGFLWLGPALAILIINFKGHIIGAGLNCGNHCRIDPSSTSQVEQIDRLDRTNRDVLGALQFVAKALEIWFMYVAAGCIYRFALHLSARDRRLPVSLLLVYAEFMDLLYLKDLAVKARDLAMQKEGSGRTLEEHTKGARTPRVLYVFILLAALLCGIANLMGVATATLVIPGLQWMDINMDDSTAFSQILSSDAPRDDREVARCAEGSFARGDYNCTANLYAASLDELVEAGIASQRQIEGRGGILLPPISREAQVSFSFNLSNTVPITWVPSRKHIRAFSMDVANYTTATTSNVKLTGNYPDSHRFNQSLQVQLQRTGPTIGLAADCYLYAGPRVFQISEDREIRCYGGYGDADRTGSKCIRWGSGWGDNPAGSSASFTILDYVSNLLDMQVTVYTTPSARYLIDPSCLSSSSCDWDQLFSDPAHPDFLNISDSQQTYEYSIPQYTNDSAVWCSNSAFLSFATYAMNPFPVSNLLQLTQLGVLHDDPANDPSNANRAATLSIHADWTLAAWSANKVDGVVPGTRGSSTRFIDAFTRFTGENPPDSVRFNIIHSYSSMQTVSLIPYTTTTLSTKQDRRAQRDREDANPYTAATLTAWGTVQLWKFGIDSRTKILGTVVLITGMVVVLVTSALWFESPKSPTQIVLAALMHEPPGDVKDLENGMPVTARLRYDSKQEEGAESEMKTGRSLSWIKPVNRRMSSFGFDNSNGQSPKVE